MIWYVATLIASVISTRGLAAQGELKCSVPALPLPMCSSPSSPSRAPRPLREPRLFAGRGSGSGRARSGALPGRAGGRGPEGQAGGGPRPRAAGDSGKKTPWDRGRLCPPSAPGLPTRVPSRVPVAGAAGSSSAGEAAAFPTLGAGEFAGVRAGCSTLVPPLRRRALQEGATRSPGTRHPRPRDRVIGPGRPPLQLAPLLTTDPGSQRSDPPLRAGGAWRPWRGEERGSPGGLRGGPASG